MITLIATIIMIMMIKERSMMTLIRNDVSYEYDEYSYDSCYYL